MSGSFLNACFTRSVAVFLGWTLPLQGFALFVNGISRVETEGSVFMGKLWSNDLVSSCPTASTKRCLGEMWLGSLSMTCGPTFYPKYAAEVIPRELLTLIADIIHLYVLDIVWVRKRHDAQWWE